MKRDVETLSNGYERVVSCCWFLLGSLFFRLFGNKKEKMKSLSLILLFCCLISAVSAATSKGVRTLIVHDAATIKNTHKQFFSSLEAAGYKLTYASASSSVKFIEYGEFLYDNLILFAPKANSFGNELTTLNILNFMNNGGNVLVAGSHQMGEAVSELANECGVFFDEEGTVIDHFSFHSTLDDGTHTVIKTSNLLSSKVYVNEPINKPILFKGVAQKLRDNPMVFQVLGGNPTSFAGQPSVRASAPFVIGKETTLVSSLQARNNARITFSGSLDLFSDKFFGDESANNKKFAQVLTSWTFHERGVLRVVKTTHHKVGETIPPAHYIIKEQMEYSIFVEEWNGEKWVPFKADDMQVEFKMLDPYIRTTLEADGQGKFSKVVTLPDVYGVFTFRVEYNRIGYTFLDAADVVPIHPLLHNQYERFIQAAYPYYASAFSMMVGLFFFSFFFLYHREKDPKGKKD